MAIFDITINMLGAFETRANQPETIAKTGVNVTQQSPERDNLHYDNVHQDGLYLLEMQVAPLVLDASPSRPVLYSLHIM